MIILSEKYKMSEIEELSTKDSIIYFDSINLYKKVARNYSKINIDMCYWSDRQEKYVTNLYTECLGDKIIVKPKEYPISWKASKKYIIVNKNENRKKLV